MSPSFKAVVPWLLFALGLVFATAPVWRIWVFGFHPTLDELLLVLC